MVLKVHFPVGAGSITGRELLISPAVWLCQPVLPAGSFIIAGSVSLPVMPCLWNITHERPLVKALSLKMALSLKNLNFET